MSGVTKMGWMHQRGRFWHYRFAFQGKEYTGTTRSTDYDIAMAILEEVRNQVIQKKPSPRTVRRMGESNPNILRQIKLKMSECRCEVCGWGCSRDTLDKLFNKRITTLEMHHIIPVRHGGDDRKENLIALCPQCHWIADRHHKIRIREELVEKILEIQRLFRMNSNERK
jgi:predicted restriction endonuclease